jgi:5-methylcytosine-specific restriction enzyme B
MALITNKRDLSAVVRAFQHCLQTCFVQDGSLFSSASLWTPALIEEVRRAFVDHPDAGRDDFITKLQRQMKDSSSAAQQLMAEMIWVLLAFPSNIKAETKRGHIREIWALSKAPLPSAHPLLGDELLVGIGSGGPGFNNHRWRELVFLIALAGAIKKLDASERRKVLNDYDAFLRWLDTVPREGHRQFRHMLRFFCFPDRVERMSTNGDRRRILAAFGVAARKDTKKWRDEELDAALLQLRQKLQRENPDVILDFYEHPLEERWQETEESDDPDDATPRAASDQSVMRFDPDSSVEYAVSEHGSVGQRTLPILKILYGPPGTGKTRKAASEAVRAVDAVAYRDAMRASAPEAELARLHRDMVKDGRIVWVTFHPSYSYEDFVEGYRPISDERGHLGYKVIDGPFKLLCARARTEADLNIGERLEDAAGNPAGVVVDKDGGGWLIRVMPGRADEVAPEQEKYVSRLILQRFIEAKLPPEVFSIPGMAIKELADFGINSEDADIPPPDTNENETKTARKGSTIRRIVASRAHVSSSDLANSSHYGAVYRRLLQLKKGTRSSRVALVIDEINRADPSRVLGELLTLLEIDKREGMPEARQVWLPYSKALFSVPLAVSVIGTMNTVDRSLAAMDFAMRRRFEFELIDAQPNLCPSNYGGVDVRSMLQVINRRIDVLLGKHYRIGHAALMKPALDDAAGLFEGSNSGDRQLRALAHQLRRRVIPTILEYFRDDWYKARAVIGFASHEGVVHELFTKISADAALIERLPDEQDLADSTSYDLADWWDPEHAQWAPERFANYLAGAAKGV